MAWCIMEAFILSNLLTVKIDGRQQHEETRSLLKTGDQCTGQARNFEFRENLRSWMALCAMDMFIPELVSNQLTVPVKIDGRQQQEDTSALLKREINVHT